jgi:hypothetical protein
MPPRPRTARLGLALLGLAPALALAAARAPAAGPAASRAAGGLGAPPPASADEAGGGGEDEPKDRKRGKAPADKERPRRRETVVLPHPGVYRAPAILRLAAQLYGLPVRVASPSLNDVEVEIPNALARRPVDREEILLFLAAHSLHLHVWDHPEHGKLLVASDRPDWTPEEVVYRKVLQIGRGRFESTWAAVKAAVDRHNEVLAEGARRIVAVPHERTGKIFLWSPKREWLDGIAEVEEKLDAPRESERQRLFAYRGRHRRAEELEAELLEKLSAGEKERMRTSVADFGNQVLWRADSALGEKVRGLLEELDRTKRRAPRRVPAPEPSASGAPARHP